MDAEMKPIKLKVIFLDAPPHLGQNKISLVDTETGRPILGVQGIAIAINEDKRDASFRLVEYDLEIKNNG